ncbi:MAG: ATP-binding protein [Deltaproteobacteria bacterium]|nr:ATP-binding protein [Deltaproteobacteria bacterium]
MDFYQGSGKVLEQEMAWFNAVLEARIAQYFKQKEVKTDPLDIPAPELKAENSTYVNLISHYNLAGPERLIIMLALAPDIRPQILDIFYSKNSSFDRGFTEFGGIVGTRHSGFIPTIETAFFLLTGGDLSLRMRFMPLFEQPHVFQRFRILDLDLTNKAEPFASIPLRLGQDIIDLLLLGYVRDPEISTDFPARRLQTDMEWDDLVLCPQTTGQLIELHAWLDHGDTLLREWNLKKHIKPGYRCLFYGPPGTGKTLTATLLGKLSHRHVFRIDLSQLVSKYIGETEKNLERIFRQAEQRDWILFFDEADSLFGKRTQISDAHDRYANQGTAYLLQRLEDCPNVVILASNQQANIDEAFTRRFQSTVFFPMPKKEERLKLWRQGFSPISTMEKKIDLEHIADKYELSGGAIINVIRYCSLMAIQKNTTVLSNVDLIAGIQKEYHKEGRLPFTPEE